MKHLHYDVFREFKGIYWSSIVIPLVVLFLTPKNKVNIYGYNTDETSFFYEGLLTMLTLFSIIIGTYVIVYFIIKLGYLKQVKLANQLIVGTIALAKEIKKLYFFTQVSIVVILANFEYFNLVLFILMFILEIIARKKKEHNLKFLVSFYLVISLLIILLVLL